MYQQSYIAKTKEEEMVNAIIELAAHGELPACTVVTCEPLLATIKNTLAVFIGERKYGKKVKRKSLFQKVNSLLSSCISVIKP